MKAQVFNQNATQKQYLLQQIAALKVYAGYLQKGYSIAKHGLSTISDIKKGDLRLHTGYFDSLKVVNPSIRNYGKVAGIMALQRNILKRQKTAIGQVQQSKAFTATELDYVSGVFSKLLADCGQTIDELTAVTTNGNLQMKDDERLKRIDALYANMQRRYTFVQAFAGDAQTLAASRLYEQQDIENSRAINGIKQQQP